MMMMAIRWWRWWWCDDDDDDDDDDGGTMMAMMMMTIRWGRWLWWRYNDDDDDGDDDAMAATATTTMMMIQWWGRRGTGTTRSNKTTNMYMGPVTRTRGSVWEKSSPGRSKPVLPQCEQCKKRSWCASNKKAGRTTHLWYGRIAGTRVACLYAVSVIAGRKAC